jgi:tight adherence protein C
VSPLLIGILVFATVYLGVLALRTRRPAEEIVGARLSEIAMLRAPREVKLSQPFLQRALVPLVTSGARLVVQVVPPNSIATVRSNLAMAGRRHSDPLAWIFSKWLATAVVGGLVFAVGLLRHLPAPVQIVGTVAFAGLAYLWPELKVRSAIRQRQTRIVKELPETLDLLTISVEAGLGLDQALEVVTSRRIGPLSDEIRMYLDEVRLGADRKEALRGIGVRTGVEDLISFTATLVQAMEFGVSIATILRVQSQEVRLRRRQRIEERAMKAPVKLMFPLIFLILPALFVVAAGPGFIRAYTEFIHPVHPGTFTPPPLQNR